MSENEIGEPPSVDLYGLQAQARRMEAQLSIRIGRDHPAAHAFTSVIREIDELTKVFRQASTTERIREMRGQTTKVDYWIPKIDDGLASIRKKLEEFLDEAERTAS